MSGLVAVLVGLAAWFADRAVRSGRTVQARGLAGFERAGRTDGISVPPGGMAIASATIVGAALWGPAGAPAGALLALAAVRVREHRRRRAAVGAMDEQLADAARAIAAAVRAGMSVPQALAYVAAEAVPPLATHFSVLVDAVEVGVPLADALEAFGAGVGTDDARLVAAALELHRRAGGDLPTVLEQVAATIRERVEAAQEVRALTAQARLSGVILGLLPIGFFAFLWITSRRDMETTLTTPAGAAAVVLGLVLELGAFVWIRSLLAVDR